MAGNVQDAKRDVAHLELAAAFHPPRVVGDLRKLGEDQLPIGRGGQTARPDTWSAWLCESMM